MAPPDGPAADDGSASPAVRHLDLTSPDLRGPDTRDVRVERVRGVRTLTVAPPGGATGAEHVVVLPGLGALGYLVPLVRELGRCGLTASLLDLPGFGHSGSPTCPPTVADVADVAARWCEGLPDGERIVLVGHSTGAQAALLAALALAGRRPAGAVVLAGPTVSPNQRSLPRLVAMAPLAYRRDSPAELAVLGDYRRGGRDVLRLLRSAIADRPERNVRELTAPLVVTAGRSDAFAPPGWLVALAHAAASRSARVVRLPGSHNNPYTHPEAVATVVTGAVGLAADAAARPRRRSPRRSPTVVG